MKNLIILIAFCMIFAVSSLFANDGSFYASGNTLIPLQETQIQLKKELLKFHISDFSYMNVEIDFEFYNPGAEKTLTVGFVSPPAFGDIDEELSKNPNISDFTVSINDENIKFQLKRMDETAFKLNDEKIDGYDFVYYFPVNFKKGVNKIRHTYRFLGGNSIETQRDFSYQITTGKRWANKQIDDFELQVHLDKGIYFIPATFNKNGKSADWQIVGDGVISKISRDWFIEGSQKIKMAHLNSGYLVLKEKNFKPDDDIFLGEYNWGAGWINSWCKTEAKCFKDDEMTNFSRAVYLNPRNDIDETQFKNLNRTQLKLLRNYYFALAGYEFQDKTVKNFYNKFFWYKPNPNVKTENVNLTDGQKTFIETIKKVENGKTD